MAWPAGTGQPVVDRLAPGRGAWLHPTESCMGTLRQGDLARAFRRTVSPEELGSAVAACRAAVARVGDSG